MALHKMPDDGAGHLRRSDCACGPTLKPKAPGTVRPGDAADPSP